MLTSLPKNDKIYQIDYGSQSDEDESDQPKVETHRVSSMPKPNPQVDPSSLTKREEPQSQKAESQSTFENSAISGLTRRIQPLRRNKSFKAKKMDEQTPKIKPNFNRSVSKFTNIFEQIEEINFGSESKFAVYEQTKKTCQLNEESTVRSGFLKSSQLDLIKNVQQAPVLKISNLDKAKTQRKSILKKSVRFAPEGQSKQKMMRKTGFYEKPMMAELIDRKLSQQCNSRAGSKASSTIRRDVKIRLKAEQVKDMDVFVHAKISSAFVLVARLKKDTSGLNWLWPEYHMHELKSDTHILSAKKKAANTTSNYYISRNQKQIDVQNDKYSGKVRSNFLGSCFNIFSKGVNPQNLSKGDLGQTNVRKLLATIIYQSQIINANPKSMQVYMVKSPYTYYDLQGVSLSSQQKSLQSLYKIGNNSQKIHLFHNRKPTYHKKENRFSLNFDGRVKKPSTKNFILEDAETKREVFMFGKVEDDEYVMHISSPLTPHVALGIALAELDSKIICD